MILPFTMAPSMDGLKLNTTPANEYFVEFVGWYRDSGEYELIQFSFELNLAAKVSPWLISEASNGIGEVPSDQSRWLQQLNDQQVLKYPQNSEHFADLRHFFFGGHDLTIEVLARDCQWKALRKLQC